MLLVKGFLRTLAVIDTDGTLEADDLQVTEGFAAEVVERAVLRYVVLTNRLALFALQMERRGWGVDAVEVPMGGRYVDA